MLCKHFAVYASTGALLNKDKIASLLLSMEMTFLPLLCIENVDFSWNFLSISSLESQMYSQK